MGYDARTVAFAALSTPMRLALIDLVSRGGMYRSAGGFLGALAHLHPTMLALEARGLVKILPTFGRARRVEPTKAGERMIMAEFRGDRPAIVDCDERGLRR